MHFPALHSLFLRLAPFIRGRHSRVIHTTDLARFYAGCPSCRSPALSALTRATPVLGHTRSLIHTHIHSLRPVSFVQFTYTACLWMVEETPTDMGRTCKLHTERHPGSAGTRTRDLLATTVSPFPALHPTVHISQNTFPQNVPISVHEILQK